MRYNKLQDWLTWQESLNPKEIDLGLDRVSQVFKSLNFSADFFCPVITVAGTNGKGSTVAFIESILKQSNISVGSYTSPHLFKYNERFKINQQAVSDDVLCEAFDVIDQARGDVPLTYFEFATLAALVIFKKFQVDVVLLEVGLGGRLDAVNVIDANVAVITSIAIDHIDWLGDDIELIGREKAGIMRPGKPAVVSIFKAPESLLKYAEEHKVKLITLGKDYLYQGLGNNSWQLKAANFYLSDLPVPALKGGFQIQNAAAAIMAISLLELPQKLDSSTVAKGLQKVSLAGRYQQICESPRVIVDVAHNEQSARMLSNTLGENPVKGKTIAVVAMLADKEVGKVLAAVQPEIDHWVSAGFLTSRAMSSKNLAQAVRAVHTNVKLSVCESVTEACVKARTLASEEDRIIVFGSFYTVSEATAYFNQCNDN
ncbi:MAG: bifunctional tetrahydrofolate synthase/dihydrofolate synthase [Gammaproteobacteria bacterium]|nr:bifunctional tetrahydrofolate synthase/dihydrofolate synthase [Gammaproteobacteria bacterium]